MIHIPLFMICAAMTGRGPCHLETAKLIKESGQDNFLLKGFCGGEFSSITSKIKPEYRTAIPAFILLQSFSVEYSVGDRSTVNHKKLLD